MSVETALVAQEVALPAPRPPMPNSKIALRHLARRALIYVRQSSPTQVQRHPESTRCQYALPERAEHPPFRSLVSDVPALWPPG